MLAAVAVLSIFVYGLMSALLGALLPTYGLASAEQGSVALANALGLVIASLSAGPLVDLKGKKVALQIGLSLIGIALVAASKSVTYPSLLAVYFTLGIGGGIVTTGANSLVSDIAPQRRGPALNFANLFFGLGGVITTFAVTYLFGPAMLCYSIAALAAIALVLAIKAPTSKPPGQSHFDWRQVPRLLASPILMPLSMLLFLYVACEVGVWNWLKIYLISAHFDPQTAGGIVSYGFAMGLLAGRVAVARLLLKISAAAVLIAASLLIAITTLALLNVGSKAAVTMAVLCAGIAMAPVFPTTLSLVGDHFPKATATAMGIAVTGGWLGLAVSSPLIGQLAARYSLRHALLLLPACSGAMVLVSLVLIFRLRRPVQT